MERQRVRMGRVVQEVRAPRCSGHSAAFPAFLLIFGWHAEISPQLGRSVCNRGRGGKQETCQKQPQFSLAMSFDWETFSSVFLIRSSGMLFCVSALTNALIHGKRTCDSCVLTALQHWCESVQKWKQCCLIANQMNNDLQGGSTLR